MNENEQLAFDDLIGRLAPEAKVACRLDIPRTRVPRDWLNYFTAGPYFDRCSFASWRLWSVTDGRGRERLVLFQGKHSDRTPGCSLARVFVFDGDANLLTKSEFETGWRIDIHDAHWIGDVGHGFPCLLVRSGPGLNGADIASQFYALLEDDFVLVRLENSGGEFVALHFHNRGPDIGSCAPERTSEQWEISLRSPDRAEVLRSLVWLGGDHFELPAGVEYDSVERSADAAVARETRRRPGTRSAVTELIDSDVRWVREAARRAWESIEKE